MVMYVVYTEPVQNRAGHTPTGNEVKVFCRDFDEEKGVGKSKVFAVSIDHVVPSFDLKEDKVEGYLAERLPRELQIGGPGETLDKKVDRLMFLLKEDNPHAEFAEKYYSREKRVIHAILKNREYLNDLPDFFLKNKYSPSTYVRWLYPPFTIVKEKKRQLILPKRKKFVDKKIILADKKCALDIETTEYTNPKNERITNVVLNFGDEKYIITAFQNAWGKFRDYDLIHAKDTDTIKKEVERFIREKDPLILYGFNLPFDQEKLRELGDEEYLPGVDETRPVFKSVQGIKNIITRGRFTADLYGFLFLYKNLYKNNKLETHAGVKKTMDHVLLELKMRKAEQGDLETIQEVLGYVADDGDITYDLGEKNIDNIVSRAWFIKRTLSTICTTSSKAITEDYQNKTYYFRMNTFRDRYVHGYHPFEFDPENKKDELLNLERKNCLENTSVVYPIFFIKSLWDQMIRGTTGSLKFGTPFEKLNAAQTLNSYIMHTLAEYFKIKKNGANSARLYAFESQYSINFSEIDYLLEENIRRMNELLKVSGLINYSKKFLYVKNPEKIVDEKLGFLFGTGPTLFSGNKIVSLIDGNLIYQGFGLTKGKKTNFDSELAEEIIRMRLLLRPEEDVIGFVKEKISDLKTGKVPKDSLLFKKTIRNQTRERKVEYGIVNGKRKLAENFLVRNDFKPDCDYYINNFLRAFWDILSVDFRQKNDLKSAFFI